MKELIAILISAFFLVMGFLIINLYKKAKDKMKTLFTLKEVQWPHGYTLTNNEAEIAYKTGELPSSYMGFRPIISKRVFCRLYTKELTFEEWLDRYDINIA